LRGGLGKDLIILAPGLGGWMHDLQMFNASCYFERSAISVNGEEDPHKLAKKIVEVSSS